MWFPLRYHPTAVLYPQQLLGNVSRIVGTKPRQHVSTKPMTPLPSSPRQLLDPGVASIFAGLIGTTYSPPTGHEQKHGRCQLTAASPFSAVVCLFIVFQEPVNVLGTLPFTSSYPFLYTVDTSVASVSSSNSSPFFVPLLWRVSPCCGWCEKNTVGVMRKHPACPEAPSLVPQRSVLGIAA